MAWQGEAGQAGLGAVGRDVAWYGPARQARRGLARLGGAGTAWWGLVGRGAVRQGSARQARQGRSRQGRARPGPAWHGRHGEGWCSIRIVAILPAYPPRSNVGAWLASHRFLAHLVAAGHHVDVFVRSDRGQPAATLDGVSIGSDNNQVAVDVAVAMADVVISHVGDTDKAAALAAKWDKPNLRMCHGKVDRPESLEGAAMIVFNSINLAESVDCPVPWIVCRPPVDAARFRTTPGDRVTLVNLSEAKGGELFWRLVRCAPHRRFLAVKGAYGNQYLEEAPNAVLVPTTANMRDDVFARTRILLMPSERETWGMTGVEAMASGIPVIAHPTDGLVESLGDAGIFVDRADGQGWLDEIERLHDPVEWAAASRSAVARSAELDPQPDLDRFATAIEQLHCTGVPA